MAILSSLFWLIGFILSVVIAPQLRIWSWGPTLFCFALATTFALPVLWQKKHKNDPLYILVPGIALVIYMMVRAYFSPVAELGLKDSLLVAMAVSTFVVFRAVAGERMSGYIWVLGIAALLGATLWVMLRQFYEPGFSPVFPKPETPAITGFHGHYSYCASFLIPTSLILASLSILGRLHWSLRACLFALSLLGIAGVIFTKSRGGVIAAGCGVAALILGCIIVGKRDRRAWFAPLAIIAPIAMIGLAVLYMSLLENVEQSRGGSNLTQMLDNSIRFYMLGIAFSCISMHPWLGGGSGSYSWECFRFWDFKAHGSGGTTPEHVHNELVQTVSEYGIVGALLLIIFLVATIIYCGVRSFSRDGETKHDFADAWRIGGLAGLVGLFAHSNFEGILRIPPGAISLALCLAAMSLATSTSSRHVSLPHVKKVILSLCAIAAMFPLFTYGWKGSKATLALWPVFFGEQPMSFAQKNKAYSAGISIWPLMNLYELRGVLYHTEANLKESAEPSVQSDLVNTALTNYRSALNLHPYHPKYLFNLADLLSFQGKFPEAVKLFQKGIAFMGDMESAFHGHHRYAESLHNKAIAEDANGDLEAANKSINEAVNELQKTFELHNPWGEKGFQLFLKIHTTRALILENAGDYAGALQEFDTMCATYFGASGHFLAAYFYAKRADACKADGRSEDALRLFMESKQRATHISILPEGVTPELKALFEEYINNQIKILTTLNVTPSAEINF
jgi:O-antigen ligase